jgi:hypothetical protein
VGGGDEDGIRGVRMDYLGWLSPSSHTFVFGCFGCLSLVLHESTKPSTSISITTNYTHQHKALYRSISTKGLYLTRYL